MDCNIKAALINAEVPESLDNAAKNLTDKPTRELGTTLADMWYLIFGGISEAADKKRLKIATNIAQYKTELDKEIQSIPQQNLQEPKFQVVGPALDKSRYCVEEKALRAMFVQLISKSMDSRFLSKVHPSFTEIISQMSPLDADNICHFKNDQRLPIAEYRLIDKDDAYSVLQTNATPFNTQIPMRVQATSMQCLSRFGLINISYDEFITDPLAYRYFDVSQYSLQLRRSIPNASFGERRPFGDENIMTKRIEIHKGSACITPLGQDFLAVCLA